jgi:hypothetical protein
MNELFQVESLDIHIGLLYPSLIAFLQRKSKLKSQEFLR